VCVCVLRRHLLLLACNFCFSPSVSLVLCSLFVIIFFLPLFLRVFDSVYTSFLSCAIVCVLIPWINSHFNSLVFPRLSFLVSLFLFQRCLVRETHLFQTV
jgi:hypothetical protein